MIQWDQSGTKGAIGKYEITVLPKGDGWSAIIWIHKTHLTTIAECESKVDAQVLAENYIEELDKVTERLLDRIGYEDDYTDLDDDDHV